MKITAVLFTFLFISFTGITACSALTPAEVLVVTNKADSHSHDLAVYYMQKRDIPAGNLIELESPVQDECSRNDYEQRIASPIRAFLKNSDPSGSRFKCLALIYGIPLRIQAPEITEKKLFKGAAVDSELALVREEEYKLDGWLPNKYFLEYKDRKVENMPQNVMLVSRLDGPSEEIVRRIIDDSLETERKGLKGKAYFDARWPNSSDEKGAKDLFAFYDKCIHNTARIIEESRRMPVIVDSQEKLFQAGECPDAALYCGWYSLEHYIDAFTWVRGAVGFHIASFECTTLKNGQGWCKEMLDHGVAATLGAVAEPYLHTFPRPDFFFKLLADGRFTLAECYAMSNPYWSWQMVLIGDPLYRPFMINQAHKESN